MNHITKPQFINPSNAAALLNKWQKLLDVDTGRPLDKHTRLSTALVLENQERWFKEAGLLKETNSASTGGVFGTHQGTAGAFSGDRYAAGDSRLPKVIIPMIRRVFPELISHEIVGVQPMNGPVGLAFALRFKYEADALGGNRYDNSPNNSVNAARGITSLSDGNEMGFNYLNTGFTGTSSASLTGLAGLFENVTEEQGVARALADAELTSDIPQVKVSLEKTSVEAGTRRLATEWSLELEQDLYNMNGLDIGNEMVNAMSYELQAEIDHEMIVRMRQICFQAGSGIGYSSWSALSADARYSGERLADFYNKLLKESNIMAVRNRRGPANFIIATPTVCAMIERMPDFKFFETKGDVDTSQTGVARVGMVGRFKVYRDTRTEAYFQFGTRATRVDYAMLGFKGADFWDTGIVYCPYIPIMMQKTISPKTFSPVLGLMTRYGVVDHIFGANLYYHLVLVTGLGTAFTPGTAATFF